MSAFAQALESLAGTPRTWAVTGAAGFIGSNLLQRLLSAGQKVIGLDNLVTGHRRNLEEVAREVGPGAWSNFRFVEGDIRDPAACDQAFAGVDYVLHQAALGSVPLSLERPDETHAVNVTGFIEVLQAARRSGVRRFVYASSCAVYGDDAASPKVEDRLGRSLSPYATSKRVNELYAEVFTQCYGLPTLGLRYFNVYGRRQDPNGAYAAVIPRWMDTMLQGEAARIHGDGQTTRDFCFVQDIVQANLLAAVAGATAPGPEAASAVCNVGTGVETSLNVLCQAIRDVIGRALPGRTAPEPIRGDFRSGDIRFSRADISQAQHLLGFAPEYDLGRGLADTFEWYLQNRSGRSELRRLEPTARP